MVRKLVFTLALIFLTAFASLAQSRSMYVGDVELRIGMAEEAVMKALSKYKLSVSGTSFIVTQYNETKKLYDFLGAVGFEKGQLTYLSRDLDVSAWPRDEGFSVARAIYDALNGSIARTDSDGAKRTNATIVINSHDSDRPTPMNLRIIDIYVDVRKITLMMTDGSDGKTVSASVSVRLKPW